MPWLASQLCSAHRGNICHQVLSTSYSLLVQLIKVLDHLDLTGLDDVKDEARCFCRCRALSTSCFSAEPWQNSCHATLSSNISLTLPFISQAEPPPPFVWLLPLLSHHHNQLNSHVMVIIISFIFNRIQQLNNARKNTVYISVTTLKHCCRILSWNNNPDMIQIKIWWGEQDGLPSAARSLHQYQV